MSFFTDELMKCTDEFEGRKCIGNAMYIPLGENNRLKIFFTTLGYADHYEALSISAIDKNNGVIDKTTIVCGSVSAVVLLLLYRQSRLLNAAMVIYDSRILTVPSCVVTSETRPKQTQAEETIVSTFGLLLGNRVYQWGCEGVYGVRLREVQIDKSKVLSARILMRNISNYRSKSMS